MDGEVHDVPNDRLADNGVIYRPTHAAAGVRGVVSYVYRGEGIAEYVAGIDDGAGDGAREG